MIQDTNNPHLDLWRKALAAQYSRAVRTGDNVNGVQQVLTWASFTEGEIADLRLFATMSDTDMGAADIERHKAALGAIQEAHIASCECAGCKVVTIDEVDQCNFVPEEKKKTKGKMLW